MSATPANIPTCLFCGDTKTTFTCFEDAVFNNKTFQYLKCCNCDLIYVYPSPTDEDLMKMYPVEYQGAFTEKGTGRYTTLFKQIRDLGTFKTILDYGCGGGRFVVEAIDEKYEVVGAEYNPALVANLKSAFPSASFQTINDLFASQQKFDIIFLSNVVEHLTQPKETMLQLMQHLNDNGIFVLEGPVENNFNLTLLTRKTLFFIRKYLFHKKAYHTPTHLLYSNRKNQEQLFKDVGLTTLFYTVDESNWPFPSALSECKSTMQKLMYYIATFSVKMSKHFSFWGNNFTYIGKKTTR